MLRYPLLALRTEHGVRPSVRVRGCVAVQLCMQAR